MTNTVFSPALQAPITLSNPTGSITVVSDPATIKAQANPIPPNAPILMVGSAVKLALGISIGSIAASIASAAPVVVSGASQFAHPASGNITFGPIAPIVTQANVTNTLTFPRVMLVGVGGDQSYGCNAATSYPRWTTAAGGSAANVAIQTIGAYDVAILSGVFEGWDTSGVRDREDLTQALLKNATYPITKSTARPLKVFYYEIMNSTASGNPYAKWQALVDANNWYMYESAGGVGTKTPAGGGEFLINYSAAWPTAIGSAGIGASICGSNYGTTSSGSPTGPQGPARTFGNYAALKLLIRGSTVDPRFLFNAQMASPSAAGIFLDEVFVALDGQGSAPDSSLDGITIAPGSQQGGGFPHLDTVQPVMARGNHNTFDQLQTMLTTYGTAGKTYYNFGNFGQYANKYQFGTTTLTAGLENTLHGGLLENVLAAGASSWECFQIGNTNTGNTTYASGWPNLLANYYQGMDFCQSPKLVGVGTKLPATDGSQIASIPSGAGTTLTTVSTGTAQEYQLMRYGLCTTLLDDGYFCPGVTGYDWSLLRWYDEYGDDSLTQVNVPRGYLGTALSTRPTSPTWAQGTLGVWSRSFTGGIALVNPRGNGAQTVTLPQTYQKLTGTQQASINSGATVTTVTLADGDGIILITPSGFLAAGHWVAAKMPLNLVHPRPDSETIPATGPVFARHHIAYYDGVNSVQFESPCKWQGGARPHVYQIISGPSWLKIGATYGSPMYGILYGIPTGAISKASPATVVVRVFGQDKVSSDMTATLWTSSALTDFIFADSVNGNDANTGAINSKFKTLVPIMGTSNGQVTFPGSRVYLSGSFQWPTQSGSTAGYYQLDQSKVPCVFMALPGSAVTISANLVQIQDAGAGCSDLYFAGSGTSRLAIVGSATAALDTHTFELYNPNRCTWWNVDFQNPINQANGSNTNSTSIFTSNSGIVKSYYTILGCTETGRSGGAGNSMLMTAMFSVKNVVFEFNTIAGQAGFGVFFKDSNTFVTAAYNRVDLQPNASSSGAAFLFGCQTNNEPHPGNCEACYNFVTGGTMFADFQGFAGAISHWFYRNTVYTVNTNYNYALGDWGPAGSGPYFSDSDVLVAKTPGGTTTAGAAFTSVNKECWVPWSGTPITTTSPCAPSTGALQNVSGGVQYRSLYLGTRGWEIQ